MVIAAGVGVLAPAARAQTLVGETWATSALHRWLAETVFVGMARDEAGQICIRFHAVE